MNTRRCFGLLAAAILGLCFVATSASAYGLTGGGGQLGYASPEDLNSTVMVGGHLEFEQAGTRVHLKPNVMYWKSGGESDVNPNLDLYYHFRRDNQVSPYLGGGMGLNMRHENVTDRSDTSLGANVLGGVRFPGRTGYFVEGRAMTGTTSNVALLGGVTFGAR
jgi:hypothetical protein